MEDWFHYYDKKYMGGDPEYPKPNHSRIFLYRDRMEIHFWNGDYYNTEGDLIVPFRSIKSIENMDEKKISALRVIGLGMVFVPLAIVGAMWKKNHTYTVIKYDNQAGEKIVILDFGDNVDTVQGWMFRRLLKSKTSSKVTPQQEFVFYHDELYGFQFKYPIDWVDDELQQKGANYIEIIKIRKLIENKSPYVTVSVADLLSRNLTPQPFINREIESISSDANMSVEESSSLIIGDKPVANLVYKDYNGYKHRIVWIQTEDMVFKISYYAEKKEYSQYLSAVDVIIHSFKISEPKRQIPLDSNKNNEQLNLHHPLMILMARFAKGEITEEQYKRMYEILRESRDN